jgi:phosphopantetheinyl transferase
MSWICAAESEWEKSKRFSILWALKEAYVKCTGQGITTDVESIVFYLLPPEITAQDILETGNIVDCWVNNHKWTVELHVHKQP